MATVYGNSPWQNKRELKKYIFLATVVSITMVSVMMIFSEDRASEVGTALFLAICCVAFLGLIFLRSNSMVWQQLFKKEAFKEHVVRETQVSDSLSTLGGHTYLFNHFIFELFRVEHLVLSERGVFVIQKIKPSGPFKIEGNRLYSGDKTLESATSNIWRVCHLINIVIRKTFKAELMPTPVFLVSELESNIESFDGISIMDLSQFHHLFESLNAGSVDSKILESFAALIKSRYLSK